MNTEIYIAFLAYFSILLAIGLISYKKQTSEADFIMGSRSLNFWLTALSAHASDMSSWLFMGFPAAIFVAGLSQSWIAVGLLLGMFMNWQFVATKLRIATEKNNSYTLSSFFESHFADKSGTLRILTATITVFFLTCYLSAGLIAIGRLLESVFGIDYYFGLTVAASVVMLYTFIGGFITVAWTDLFQAIFLLFMIMLVPAMAFSTIDGGWESIQAAASAQEISLSFIPDTSPASIMTIIFLVFGWGLGYFGQPHIVTKFMGIKDAKDLHKSKYFGISWEILALTAATAIGLVGMSYFKNGLANPELVFIEMVKSLFHPFAAGFILCGVLAASMSTMDSQILVCASIFSEDFYKHAIHKKASSKELLRVSRAGVIGISLLSLFIAFNKNATVLEAVQYAWSGLGASFGPLVLMALYSSKANKYGAIAGIVTGGVIAGTWDLVNPWIIDYAIPSMLPAFFLSLLMIYVVSVLSGRKAEGEIQKAEVRI